MNTDLRELLVLVQPPAKPSNAGGDWARIEQDLGLIFPEDYKEFVAQYGSGTLCNLLEIRTPFAIERHYEKPIREGWASWAGIYNCWGEEPQNQPPFPLYPHIPGLLPWGTFGDTNVLGWLTHGDPTKWYVTYQDQHEGFFELRNYTLVKFLVAAIKGELPLPDATFGNSVSTASRIYRPF